MIIEDYCSFEVAKLLKEKGFEGDINAYYHIWDNGNKVCPVQEFSRSEASHLYIPAPTHQMAIKWLREEKNILIYVYPVIDLPVKNNYTFYWKWDGKKKRHDAPHIGDKHNYESFEQAVEAALKYSLENLI